MGDNSISADTLGYWTQVVIKGLQDQKKLIDRAEPKVKQLSQDEFITLRNSGLKKIYQAVSQESITPLRELKTLEKAVLFKGVKSFSGLTFR
jgi:hypothetical protein